ncbi:hypothetical protein ABBQ38_012467 [Trebouxia sp. C0009 RCD-2024]
MTQPAWAGAGPTCLAPGTNHCPDSSPSLEQYQQDALKASALAAALVMAQHDPVTEARVIGLLEADQPAVAQETGHCYAETARADPSTRHPAQPAGFS